jgi:drug/metabolite transporter (DMT)-like permease
MTTERKGELFIFGETLLWSVFPIVTVLSYANLPPLQSLAWSTLFAAIFFAVLISFKQRWAELYNLSAFVDILWGTFFIGIVFYLFYFYGLKYTTVGNASVLALMEVVYSYLFFNIWKKEYISPKRISGVLLMLLGAFIVLRPSFGGTFNFGDLLIFIGVAAAPFGNYFQRRARQKVSSETILFVRSLIAAPVIFILCYVFGSGTTFLSIKAAFWLLVFNGFFLFGLTKLFWLEGIHRILVVKANALHSIGPLFTLLFAWLFLGQPPTVFQLIAFIPFFVGIILLSD